MISSSQSILLLCTLTFGTSVYAAPPVPNDFAYGMKIKTVGQASIWRLQLPEDVYRNVVRPDLGDIRIFDASGQIIPHTLRRPETTIKEPPAPISLPIFPMYEDDEQGRIGQTLRIITDNKGAIVKAIRETISTDYDEHISAYLLDATKILHQPHKLTLDWESRKETGFSVTVNVDAGDDLSAWQRVVNNATLADLRFDEHHLSHREITVPVRSYRYLRISWPSALRDVRLKEVTASFPASRQLPQQQRILITGQKNIERPASYNFDTQGYWPVNQARIIFPPHNVLMNAELASRPDEHSNWYRQYSGLFYKLIQEDESLIMSPPVTFKTTSDRYWHLNELDGGNTLDRYNLALELGWTPHVLAFVAQGQPPYILAYGSASVEPQRQAMDTMMYTIHGTQQQVSTKTATISRSYTLGGSERLEPPPKPLPWRTWLLWSVLIAGVGLLAWMVWQLSREMGKSPKSQD